MRDIDQIKTDLKMAKAIGATGLALSLEELDRFLLSYPDPPECPVCSGPMHSEGEDGPKQGAAGWHCDKPDCGGYRPDGSYC